MCQAGWFQLERSYSLGVDFFAEARKTNQKEIRQFGEKNMFGVFLLPIIHKP